MDSEFCKVTRKKWLTRGKRLNKKYQNKINDGNHNSHNTGDDGEDDVNVEAFLKKLHSICLQMKFDNYFKRATDTIKAALCRIPTTTIATTAIPPNILNDEYEFKRLVCFGLGQFTHSQQALHQLAFILNIQKFFSIPEAIYYDPVFRNSEKLILEQLKCNVMIENCEGKYFADIKTLFFMPHCPNSLTNNLLWCNWNREHLNNIILISNSFDSLINNKPKRLLDLDSSYIMNIQPFTEESSLHDDYKIHNTFNDLSVHTFDLKILPLKESNFWFKGDEPTYNDPELLCAENLQKLSLQEGTI